MSELGLAVFIGAVFLLAGAAYAAYWLLHGQYHETTDDAQVEADVVPISARTGGVVKTVKVHDNELVKAGDVLFELDRPDHSPFPSNVFTVADADQNTRLRIALPVPDCGTHPSDCQDVEALNSLDGFNLQPRLSIPFDGPIDVSSVTSDSLFLVCLGDALRPGIGAGSVIGIDQVVWDPASAVLYVESAELLDQHASYALVITKGVRTHLALPSGRARRSNGFAETSTMGKPAVET